MRWPPWNIKEDLDSLKENLDLENQRRDTEIRELRSLISALMTSQSNSTPSGLLSRLEDLELWRGKVHRMLIEVSPVGNEKLTKRGRGFAAIYGNK